MKLSTVLATALLASLSACASTPVRDTAGDPPTQEHAWLHQLVGEWEITSQSVMEAGADPIVWSSHESITSLGGLWVVNESSMDDAEQSFHSRMTLGYDPGREAFVGCYVDSMQMELWTYVGQLDANRRVLTLEAQGPAMHDPSQVARYRDRLELVSPNEKRMVSSAVDEDGNWFTFMEMVGRRVE